MSDPIITDPALGGEPQLSPSPAESTVASVPADGMTLAEINEALGKTFPTKEAALKSFKDTFSYVGKKKEDIEREVTAKLQSDDKTNQLAKQIEEMNKERFYDKNPQYANPAIRKFIEATGKTPSEVVSTTEFKEIFDKVAGYDEDQRKRTVLESNPRLSSSRDALAKARETQAKVPQMVGQQKDDFEASIVGAVKEAYGL